MPSKFTSFTFLCEGKSEVEYLSKFQEYLRDNGCFDIVFNKRVIGSGAPHAVRKAIKLERSRQRNNEIIYVLLDDDIYVRNKKFIKLNITNCVFLYNHLNFEDFLIMHFSKDDVLKWQAICEERNHFCTPLSSCLVPHCSIQD